MKGEITMDPTIIDHLKNLWELISLSPQHLWASLIFLTALALLNDLIRTALMVEYTRSAVTHVIVSILTLLPAFLLGFILLYDGYRYPERAWLNLGLAVALYFPWILGGILTKISRRDTEGTDLGWILQGLMFVTIPWGILAVIIF